MPTFPFHTGITIATVGLLLGAARLVVPAVHGPVPADLRALINFTPETAPISPLVPRTPPEGPVLPKPNLAAKRFLLEDSNGALDHFYAALWRTEKEEPGAITRIVHYGDSPTTADLITGDIRSILQRRFGNAGHGFVLVAKPWAWYGHMGVEVTGSGWQMAPASRFEARDGMFGLGGVSFIGGTSARSRVTFETAGQSRLEIAYLAQPGGGAFSVTAAGHRLGRIETAAEEKTPAFAPFTVKDGAQDVEIQVERGSVRLFGITAEKPGRGIVYDSLGMNGASITVLSRMFNEEHWAAELQHRAPSLVIVNYGTNEADFASFVDKQYEKELREGIRRLHAALPDVSVLVMSPMDRAHREGAEIVTMPTIPRIVEIQRRVAADTGCGFFDTFTAMGGSGTMSRWYTAQPRLVSADFIHPYPAGGKIIAGIFTDELGKGLNRFKARETRAHQVH